MAPADTIPVVPMVAMPVVPPLHVPPEIVSESTVVVPAHKEAIPVIGCGAARTVIDLIAAVPHPVL